MFDALAILIRDALPAPLAPFAPSGAGLLLSVAVPLAFVAYALLRRDPAFDDPAP